jgi:hypothetical protein
MGKEKELCDVSLYCHYKEAERKIIKLKYRNLVIEFKRFVNFDVPGINIMCQGREMHLTTTEDGMQILADCIKSNKEIAVNQNLIHSLENSIIQLSFMNKKMLIDRNQNFYISLIKFGSNGASLESVNSLIGILEVQKLLTTKDMRLKMKSFMLQNLMLNNDRLMIMEEKKGNRNYQLISNLLNVKQNYEGKMISYASLGNHWKLSERILTRRMYRNSDEKVDHVNYFDIPEVGVISCVWNQSLKVIEKDRQILMGGIKLKEEIVINQDLIHFHEKI